MSSGKVIVLVTSITSNPLAETAQRNLLTVFAGKNIAVEEVDGALPENKDRRSAMFKLSGLVGQYPQVFIQRGEDLTFVGSSDTLNELLECDALPEEIKTANPNIPSFSKIFVNLA